MTTAEIAKALRCCATIDGNACDECPARWSDLKTGFSCEVLIKTEAVDLIERLEKEKAALLESVRGGCVSCKHWVEGKCKIFEGCASCEGKCKCKDCGFGCNWEWKGLEGK